MEHTNQADGQIKKILYVITKSEPFGGAQRYVFDVATNMSKVGLDVVVAFGNSGKLAERLQRAKVRAISIRLLERDVHVFRDIQVFFQLLRICKQEQPDIIHLNSSKAGGLGALAARIAGIGKIVFTSHGLAFEEPRSRLVQYALRFLTWCTFVLCHDVILISRKNLQTASSFVGMQNKLHHIYNGIAEPQFVDKHEARNTLASHIGQAVSLKNKDIVGTIAELTPNKGLIYLVRACEQIIKKNTRTVCLIIGEGESHQQLEKEIERLALSNNVFLLGYIQNASQYLKAFDVFVLPSLKEGHPYTLLESGYAGLPTVGTNISGIEDILTDMQSGILVRPHDSKELAGACVHILEHTSRRQTLGTELYNTVSKKFSVETMIQKTKALYETA